jgi:small subunit ribosomal protein S6
MAHRTAYDLLILIDPEAPEERRSSIVEGVKKQISAGDGTLKGDADWGVRRLAFEIRHRPEAHYHLFQLEAGPELLDQIRHSLAIDDGVLRHRLIRLDKGAPDKPPTPPVSSRPAPRAEESEHLAEPELAGPVEQVVPEPEPSEQDGPA